MFSLQGKCCCLFFFFFFYLFWILFLIFVSVFEGPLNWAGGDGQNLGEVEAGDKHAQHILYEKNVNKKRWVCKLKQVVVLIQCSSGKFYKSDFLV